MCTNEKVIRFLIFLITAYEEIDIMAIGIGLLLSMATNAESRLDPCLKRRIALGRVYLLLLSILLLIFFLFVFVVSCCF